MLPADKLLLEGLGAKMRELRVAAKLTQDQVGDRAGFSGKYIGEIEKGLRDLPVSTMRAVVENGLGVQLESIFTGRVRAYAQTGAVYARDVTATAEILATLPMRVRRPMLALVRELGTHDETALVSRAAEPRKRR